MGNESVGEYVANLVYDPNQILSVTPEGTTSTQPDKSRDAGPDAVIICTTVEHDLSKNLDEVAVLDPSAGLVFPGALIKADQALMAGKPTPITLPRCPVTLTVNLPGLAEPSGLVNPVYSDVQEFMNNKLEEWFDTAGADGYVNNAASTFRMTKAYSKEQVAVDLGVMAEWAGGDASMQLDVSSSVERSVIVGYYKQVLYSVIMDPPMTPGDAFDESVSTEDAAAEFDNDHPPAYVNRVDYGRIFMITMETVGTENTVDLKTAFKQAVNPGVTVGGEVGTKTASILSNSTFSIVAVGGNASTPVQSFQGVASGEIEGLNEYFANTQFKRDNPGWPIAYSVCFLKDNSVAMMGATTHYTEQDCVRYPNGFISLRHDGGYVAKFNVSWQEPNDSGAMVNKGFESGEKTAGWTYTLNLPGDAKNVRIQAQAATGLLWDPWGEIMNTVINGPDNKTYRVTGTTLDRHWAAVS